jgi:hypothetical protein
VVVPSRVTCECDTVVLTVCDLRLLSVCEALIVLECVRPTTDLDMDGPSAVVDALPVHRRVTVVDPAAPDSETVPVKGLSPLREVPIDFVGDGWMDALRKLPVPPVETLRDTDSNSVLVPVPSVDRDSVMLACSLVDDGTSVVDGWIVGIETEGRASVALTDDSIPNQNDGDSEYDSIFDVVVVAVISEGVTGAVGHSDDDEENDCNAIVDDGERSVVGVPESVPWETLCEFDRDVVSERSSNEALNVSLAPGVRDDVREGVAVESIE